MTPMFAEITNPAGGSWLAGWPVAVIAFILFLLSSRGDERHTESLGRKWKDIEGLDNKIFQLRELIGHREAER